MTERACSATGSSWSTSTVRVHDGSVLLVRVGRSAMALIGT